MRPYLQDAISLAEKEGWLVPMVAEVRNNGAVTKWKAGNG
jgi:hypothetical protein